MARATQCTTVAGAWDGIPGFSLVLGIIGIVALILDAVWLALAAFGVASLTPQSLAIAAWVLMAACLTAINLLHQVREYFFDRRLICLGPDRCAMAQVVTIEDNGDGDKSMNTVLAPADFDTSETDYRTFAQAATLVYDDPGLAARGWELDPKANRSLSPQTYGHGELPFFHCEIEGSKLDDWTTALIAYLWVLFAFAAAAFVLASVITALGPIAWILWVAIALLILLASLFGLSLGDEDTGSAPAGPLGDATPTPGGPIITDSGGNSVSVGDYVALLGRPICDSGHNPKCWDELHPVKAIARIRQSEYETVPAGAVPGGILDRYCEALRQFVTDVGVVKQGLTATDGAGTPKLTCLEHPRIG
jgi:hypothetical protein